MAWLGLGVGVRVESYHGVVRVDLATVPSTEQAAACVDNEAGMADQPENAWPSLP